jgi:hypothetical protein
LTDENSFTSWAKRYAQVGSAQVKSEVRLAGERCLGRPFDHE